MVSILSLSLSLSFALLYLNIFLKSSLWKFYVFVSLKEKLFQSLTELSVSPFFFEKWKLIFLKEEKCLLVNKRLFMLTPISNFQTIKHLAKTGYFETKLSWKVLTLPQPTTVSLHSNSLKERLEIKRWKNVKCEASPRKIISITERIRSV